MRKLLLATVAAGALLAGAGGALASPHDDEDDVPGAGWRSASELEATLESQGWQVDRVKADDGQWEVYGRDPNGNYVEAKYDPYTFQQTKVEYENGPKPVNTPGSDWQPVSELQNRLTSQGWQIREIEVEKGRYEVEGTDPQGQYVEAYYDPRTLQQTSVKAKNGAGSGSSKPKKDQRRDGNGRDKGKDKDRAGKGDKNK